MRVVKFRNRFPREAESSPAVEILKTQIDTVLVCLSK